jgi:FHS family Na+ dependent glucose MFS transporter 1
VRLLHLKHLFVWDNGEITIVEATLASTRTNLKRNQSIGYFSAFVALGLATAALGPALPYLAAQTGSELNQISILFTTKAAGYLLGSIIGGRFYDRLPGHKVMFVGLVGVIITLALTPLLSQLWLLGLMLFLLGATEGVVDVGGNTLLVWVHRSEVGPFMNALHLFFGVGTFLAPIILAQSVLRGDSITWGYWLIALVILPLAVWLLRLPSPAAPTQEKEKEGLSNIWLLRLTVIFFFLYVGAEISFGGWVFTYALEMDLADEASAAYLTSAFWGAFMIGRLFSIPIATRLRPRWILTGDLTGCLLGLGLILFYPQSLTALWVGSAILGLSMASIFPTMFTLSERRMTLTGAITSWFFVGSSAGGMFFPWLIGQLFEPVGPQVTIMIILVAMLAAALLFVALMRLSQSMKGQSSLD